MSICLYIHVVTYISLLVHGVIYTFEGSSMASPAVGQKAVPKAPCTFIVST